MFLPLELTLRPSRIYAGVLLLGLGLALLGVWQVSLPVWLKALVAAILPVAVVFAWRRQQNGLHGLRFSQSGQMEILLDEWRVANLHGHAVVLPWLVSLQLVLEDGRRKSLSLWPDSADKDGVRKLRVWLKWGKPGAAA